MLLPQKTLKGRKNNFEIAIEKKAELTKLGLFIYTSTILNKESIKKEEGRNQDPH